MGAGAGGMGRRGRRAGAGADCGGWGRGSRWDAEQPDVIRGDKEVSPPLPPTRVAVSPWHVPAAASQPGLLPQHRKPPRRFSTPLACRGESKP